MGAITQTLPGQRNSAFIMSVARDFRSDTVTTPTEEQFEAATLASRGDALYNDDFTTREFEARIARLTGKEAAIFVPSGTMSNQIAIRSLLQQPPHSVIMDARAHIFKKEAGGLAFLSQATPFPVQPQNDLYLTCDDVSPHLESSKADWAIPTRLICIENPAQGVIHPQEEIIGIRKLADTKGILMHCDGARIWHVLAERLKERGCNEHDEYLWCETLSELLRPFDTVSLCFSKGIGAPVGSVLVGSTDIIHRGRHFRKMFGGGMRQTGLLTAMANLSLTRVLPQLSEVHRKARRLKDELEQLGCEIAYPVETNMVLFDTELLGFPMDDLWKALERLPDPIRLHRRRCVVHYQTSNEAIDDLVRCVKLLKESALPRVGKCADQFRTVDDY